MSIIYYELSRYSHTMTAKKENMDILSLKNVLLKTESPVLERSELSGKRFYEKITSHPCRFLFAKSTLL